jgi:hypothetical protein
MIGPIDFFHPSPAPHFKPSQVFLIHKHTNTSHTINVSIHQFMELRLVQNYVAEFVGREVRVTLI